MTLKEKLAAAEKRVEDLEEEAEQMIAKLQVQKIRLREIGRILQNGERGIIARDDEDQPSIDLALGLARDESLLQWAVNYFSPTWEVPARKNS